MKLKKSLDKEREKTNSITQESINVLSEVNGYLSEFAAEERDILKVAGLDSQLKKIESKMDMHISRANAEIERGDLLYKEKEIKNLCMKYNLKFLPSRCYEGPIPKDLGAVLRNKIKEAQEKKDPYLTMIDIERNLYILAPPKMFELGTLQMKDPVLFVKLVINGKVYYQVLKSWGNDFSPIRLVYGLINRSQTFVNIFSLLLIIISLFGIVFFGANAFKETIYLIGVFLSCFGFVTAIIYLAKSGGVATISYNEEGWNVDKSYFLNR